MNIRYPIYEGVYRILTKVSLESIAKMLGHTDIRTTRIYAKIMNSTIAFEMQTLQDKFALPTHP